MKDVEKQLDEYTEFISSLNFSNQTDEDKYKILVALKETYINYLISNINIDNTEKENKEI